ncbi:MAG: CRP-like cAMP-binding protein [Bradymonadia bacterium]
MISLSINSLFRRIPLFEPLSSDELSTLLRHVEPFVVQAGHQLFAQGDASDGMYVIERGEVAVTAESGIGSRVLLAEVGAGSVIGEVSLVDGSPRSATVESVSMTSGYVFRRAAFDALRGADEPAAYRLMLHLARTVDSRKRATEQRLRQLIEDGAPPTPDVREIFAELLKS